MQQRRALDQPYTNKVLLNGQLATPAWWLPTVIALGFVVICGWVVIGFILNKGLGVTGLSRPVFWGLMIVTFVFWVGISHAGIMISAILRLTQAEWRRPVTRAAELLTVFSLLTALLFPLIHEGRPWRAYWYAPYDFARGIFPSVRSPLVWDPAAIGTYLTGSTLFLYVALLPDLGNLRDRTTGWQNAMYTMLALGWRGNPRQWKMQTVGGILLSALMLPIFVSVHSIVSWDFAVTTGVDGWHSTIFAPYFVIGAVHSGVSAVVTMMALMRWLWKWGDFIRPEHFDALARLLIVVATGWLGFTFLELIFSLYTLEGPEIALREMQLFTWPWNALFIVFLLTAYFIPVPLWLFKKVREQHSRDVLDVDPREHRDVARTFLHRRSRPRKKNPVHLRLGVLQTEPHRVVPARVVRGVGLVPDAYVRPVLPARTAVRAKREPGIHNRHEDRTGHRAGDHQGAGVRVKWHQ